MKNSVNNLENQNENVFINSLAEAITNKNVDVIKNLLNNNNKHMTDVVLELYNKNLLTLERLQFIINCCINDLSISSSLIRKLMKNNNFELLDIIFKKFTFFDNEFIIKILFYYKNRKAVSTSDLYQQISNKKYKIFIDEEKLGYAYKNYNKKSTSLYLISACITGNEHIFKYLINHGANINTYENHEALIHHACKSKNIAIVRFLVEHGADVNDKRGYFFDETPLFIACFNGNEAIAKYLIEHGANINTENSVGETPLFKACHNGNEALAKHLVEFGLDINKKNELYEETPLHVSCKYGKNESLVKYLVENGANINEKDRCGETPLHIVCSNGNESIIKCLVEHGADMNIVNNYGLTPLFK